MTSQDRTAQLKFADALLKIAGKEPPAPDPERATDFMDQLSQMFPWFQPQPMPPKDQPK